MRQPAPPRPAAGEASSELFIADLSRVLATSRPHAGRALTPGEQLVNGERCELSWWSLAG
jgi:hypothetical protein